MPLFTKLHRKWLSMIAFLVSKNNVNDFYQFFFDIHGKCMFLLEFQKVKVKGKGKSKK